MKNIKKIMFVLMIISMGSIKAKAKSPKKPEANKQQIFLKNEFGADVVMKFIWGADKNSKWTFGFDIEEEYILKTHHKEERFTAPYSQYHLAEIEVTPAANLEGKDLAQIAINSAAFANEFMSNQTEEERRRARQLTNAASGATEIAYKISKSLNSDDLKNIRKENTFFVVEHSGNEKTKISGQKKIRVKEYKNKEHYEQEIAKVEAQKSGAAPAAAKQATSNKIVKESSLDAELKELELEERRIALQEKRLALKERELALVKNNNVVAAQSKDESVVADAVVAA